MLLLIIIVHHYYYILIHVYFYLLFYLFFLVRILEPYIVYCAIIMMHPLNELPYKRLIWHLVGGPPHKKRSCSRVSGIAHTRKPEYEHLPTTQHSKKSIYIPLSLCTAPYCIVHSTCSRYSASQHDFEAQHAYAAPTSRHSLRASSAFGGATTPVARHQYEAATFCGRERTLAG